MTERQYAEVVAELEAAKQQEAEAEGAIKEMMKQLREEFGVRSEHEARALLKKERAKHAAQDAEADAEYRRLKKALQDRTGG